MSRDALHGKKVAVLGFARQGQALARWLPSVGARVLVSDMRSPEQLAAEVAAFPQVEFVLGGHPESLLDGVDVLCLSGGVAPDAPIALAAAARGIPLTNDAQLFIERSPAPVLGITGSAGKTTTTTLVGQMLSRAYSTWVGGNIGSVLLDVFDQIQPAHRVVMELSSFQLELMTHSPQIGAVLNITPNHLDRHGTMAAYTAAKAHILTHQTADGIAILCQDDAGSRALAPLAQGRVAWFSAQDMVTDGAFLAGGRLLVTGLSSPDGNPQVVCERTNIPLRGAHNVLNVLAACAIAGAAGVPPEALAETIGAFHPVAHRLETVRMHQGITYINDSIATAPERVLAALHSFDEPLVLLLGGKDKNLPWESMLRVAVKQARQIITFGAAGGMVADLLTQMGHAGIVTRATDLPQAVQAAAQAAQAGDVVLLSPGGTSYDAYLDFAQRGEHFRQLVLAL